MCTKGSKKLLVENVAEGLVCETTNCLPFFKSFGTTLDILQNLVDLLCLDHGSKAFAHQVPEPPKLESN